MSNIQTGAERMPHDLSHLGFLAGQIGRLITISTTPVIAGDSFEMDAVGALRLSPLRRGLARSEERRVGKECRSWRWRYDYKKTDRVTMQRHRCLSDHREIMVEH